MEVKLKFGIDKLIFGMKQSDVTAIYGKPDKEYKDEDANTIFLYDLLKLRLTFYLEEDFKLGYIISSNPEMLVFGKKIIGRKTSDVKRELAENKIIKFTLDAFDTYENDLNEENWIMLQSEFGEVVKVEIGAIINDKDEFDWKFKSK